MHLSKLSVEERITMSKKLKVSRLHKTLVEQILDKNKVSYEQLIFPTMEDDGISMSSLIKTEKNNHLIYKTLVLTGKNTGPVVGVIPVDEHLDEKKLAKVSKNKKVSMVPLKDLVKTTGYKHGANTPIGIWEKLKYPIYIDNIAHDQGTIVVSSGQIGRSVRINATAMAQLVHGIFTDLVER